MSAYDINGDGYVKAMNRELRAFSLGPSLVKYLGDLSGKSALDIGCGAGYSSRLLLDCGASSVLGFDVSPKMIDLAMKFESSERIKYCVRDMLDGFSDFGTFDLVTAILSIYYCPTKEELQKCISRIKEILKKGGSFWGVVVTLNDYDQYGIRISSSSPRDGARINITLSNLKGEKLFDFESIYWQHDTYERILREAGFSFEWLPCFVSEEGLNEMGTEFWQSFVMNPPYKIFRAWL